MTKMKWIIFGIALTIYNCVGQDILFPGDKKIPVITATSTTMKPKINVKPQECSDNMNMQPYGNATDNICDCRTNYLYLPANDSCYAAYLQGPCKEGEYFVLSKDELVAKCEKNPCLKDGLVMYNDGCYVLNKTGPPCNTTETLAYNETTLEIDCSDTNVVQFVLIEVPQRKCPAGSRRNALGICKEKI